MMLTGIRDKSIIPSWDEEIAYFEECIIKDKPIENGSSTDAFNTMKLVYKIYFADQSWRIVYKEIDSKFELIEITLVGLRDSVYKMADIIINGK
jgi:hypothetical protein